MPCNSAGAADDIRTESLLALVLELYRAAQETPAEEFPALARTMVRALASIDLDEVMDAAQPEWLAAPDAAESSGDNPVVPVSRGAVAALAEHVANAIRLNRALHLRCRPTIAAESSR